MEKKEVPWPPILFSLVSELFARKAPNKERVLLNINKFASNRGAREKWRRNRKIPSPQRPKIKYLLVIAKRRENRTPPSVWIPIINKLTQQRRSSPGRNREGGGDHRKNNNFVRQQWQPPPPPSSSMDREQISLEGSADK